MSNRSSGFSLNGRTSLTSLLKLYGNKTTNVCDQFEPLDIKNLKIDIMNTIIIPFGNKNWKVLEENLVFIDMIKGKLFLYSSKYPTIDLQLYSDIVDACETNIYFYMEIANLERQLYSNDCSATIYIKTVMLKLKPEFELYNLIIGKPNITSGETYNSTIVNNIIKLLQIENITFLQISEKIKTMI